MVLRDMEVSCVIVGAWICGFSKSLGPCNAFLAELWGVFTGVQLAMSRGFTKMEVQVDSQVVASLLSRSNQMGSIGWTVGAS